MKANSKINKWLLRVSFSAFVFSILSFISYFIVSHNNQVAFEQTQALNKANHGYQFFGPYCFTDYSPLFFISLIIATGLTYLALKEIKKLYLAFFFIDISFCFFVYWFYKTIEIYASTEGSINLNSFTELTFYKSSYFDFIVFICVSILFTWQIGYQIHSLIKTLQRKNRLA